MGIENIFRENRRKGFYFSFDAFLALVVMTMSLVIVGQSSDIASDPFRSNTIDFRNADTTGQDSMRLASRQTFQVFGDSFQQELVNETVMEDSDLNRTILDGITLLWAARNLSYAKESAQRYFNSSLPERYQYRLQVNEDGNETVIYATSGIPSNPDSVSSISRLVSGHKIDRPSEGFQARASLSEVKKRERETLFFGGYVGDGDIYYNLTLPNLDTVLNVTLEGDFSGPFRLYLDGYSSGLYSPDNANLSADVFQVCTNKVNQSRCEALDPGSNTVHLDFTSGNESIGGGFLKVEYNRTEQLDPRESDFRIERKNIPGIDGIINYYGSFYVPGEIKEVEAQLHYDSMNQTIFMRMGNATVYENRTTGETTVELDDSVIRGNVTDAGLTYDQISDSTVPLRVGLKEIGFTRERANADAVAVIDNSGSMSGSRLSEAKDAGKTFVNIILNATGNRVGITGYENGLTERHRLDTDGAALNNTVDNMVADGGTCISCGILEATENVVEKKVDVLVPRKDDWRYNNSYLSGSPPDDSEGWNWTELYYNDTFWSSDQAILGNSSGVDTVIQSNGSVYFRKSFSANYRSYRNVSFGVRSDDAVSLYVNGKMVYNGTENHTGEYWNRIITGGGAYDPETTAYETEDATNYCSVSGGYTGDGDYIESVEFNGINVNSGDNSGYTDSTGDITDATVPHKSYEINVEFMTYVYSTWWGYTDPRHQFGSVVFDWDDDNQLSDNKIYKIGSCDSDGCEVTRKIKVPEKALNSTVMMRVMGEREEFHLDPCSDPSYNEIEDYSVFIPANLSASDSDIGLRPEENVVAARLRNTGGTSEFDLQVNGTEERQHSIIVMSDGAATQESGMQGVPDHNGDGTVDELDETIEAGCRAKDEHNITVYTVAFDPSSSEANETLNETANCGGGEYYFSGTGELEDIFANISNQILEASFVGQTVRTSDDDAFGRIFRDSYIRFNYSSSLGWGYGQFPISEVSERFGGSVESPKNGTFHIPEGTEPLSARVTSYSANRWTDRLLINDSAGYDYVFRLWKFNSSYRKMGDPFEISIPRAKINTGANEVSLDTAFNRNDTEGGSPDSRVFYDYLVDGSVGYSGLFENQSAAVKDAEKRLNQTLDVDGDGVVEVSVNSGSLNVSSTQLSGQPYLWGPASIKLVVWR